MKNLVLASVLLMLVGGCVDAVRLGKFDPLQDPAYSSPERFQQIGRNAEMEWKMAQDDVDYALQLRPVSQMSIWHVR